jgi:anti-sigma B factor antagonist
MSGRERQSMDVHSEEGLTVVTLPERIDTHNATAVQARFDELLADGTRTMIADLDQTEYISSAGLRVFLYVLKFLEKNGGRIALCGMKPFVADVFDIAGFSQLFIVAGSRDEAAAVLR